MTDFFSEVPPAPVPCLCCAGAPCWVWKGGWFMVYLTHGEQTGTGLVSLGRTWSVDKEDLGFQ